MKYSRTYIMFLLYSSSRSKLRVLKLLHKTEINVRGENGNNEEEKSPKEELREYVAAFFSKIEAWIRPDKNHPIILQILLFVIKLPFLIVFLTVSPVFMLILFIILFVAV